MIYVVGNHEYYNYSCPILLNKSLLISVNWSIGRPIAYISLASYSSKIVLIRPESIELFLGHTLFRSRIAWRWMESNLTRTFIRFCMVLYNFIYWKKLKRFLLYRFIWFCKILYFFWSQWRSLWNVTLHLYRIEIRILRKTYYRI